MKLESSLSLDRGPGRMPHGTLAVANESRFEGSHLSTPLTAYAVGYPDDEGLMALLDLMYPRVPVSRRFEYLVASEADEYVAELDDIRAIGARGFSRYKTGSSTVDSKTYNKGLTKILDKDEMVDGDEERAVAQIKRRLTRNDLRRGFAMLDSACTNVNMTFSTSTDPDMLVMAELETGNLARGIAANLVVMGNSAWTKRQMAYRANDKAGSFASATMSREQVAGFLGVDHLEVSKQLYRTGKGKTKQRFVANYIYMLFNAKNPDREDPSNCKRFVTPVGEGDFRVYREETVKTIEISVEHYSRLAVPNTLGMRRGTVA